MIQDGPMQYLHSSARRLYRIFIHAYEHHNETFRAFEVSPTYYCVSYHRTKQACTHYFSPLHNGIPFVEMELTQTRPCTTRINHNTSRLQRHPRRTGRLLPSSPIRNSLRSRKAHITPNKRRNRLTLQPQTQN